jgi:hypothetical protein
VVAGSGVEAGERQGWRMEVGGLGPGGRGRGKGVEVEVARSCCSQQPFIDMIISLIFINIPEICNKFM